MSAALAGRRLAGGARGETEEDDEEEDDRGQERPYEGVTPIVGQRYRRRRRRLQSHLEQDSEFLRRSYDETNAYRMALKEEKEEEEDDEEQTVRQEQRETLLEEQQQQHYDQEHDEEEEEEEEGAAPGALEEGDEEDEEEDAQLVIDEEERDECGEKKMAKLQMQDVPPTPATSEQELGPTGGSVGHEQQQHGSTLNRILKQKLEEHRSIGDAGDTNKGQEQKPTVPQQLAGKPSKQQHQSLAATGSATGSRKASCGSTGSVTNADEAGSASSDLVPVSKLLDNATNPALESYFR